MKMLNKTLILCICLGAFFNRTLLAEKNLYDITIGNEYVFEEGHCNHPSAIKIDDSHVLCAYHNEYNNGIVSLFHISENDGTISFLDSLEFDSVVGQFPDLIKVNDSLVLCVYDGSGNDGTAVIFQIDLQNNAISKQGSCVFDDTTCHHPQLAEMGSNYFLCIYESNPYDGCASILFVNTEEMSVSETGDFIYETYKAKNPDLIKIDENHYLCAVERYLPSRYNYEGWAYVLFADPTEVYTIHRLQVATPRGKEPAVVKIDEQHFLFAYQGEDSGSNGDDGWATILTLDENYHLSAGTAFEYDSESGGDPALSRIDNNHVLCVYSGEDTAGGSDSDGWAKVLETDYADTTINIVSSLEYDSVQGMEPCLARLFDNYYFCAYKGYGWNGIALRFYIQGIEKNTVVTNPQNQIPGNTIPATSDSLHESVEVFKFVIKENSGNDELPTKVTKMRFDAGTNNTANWNESIESIMFYKGEENIPIQETIITDSSISVYLESDALVIPNNSETEVIMGIYLKSSGIQDNAILQFFIDADNHGFEADSSGSDFANQFESDINSENFTLEVIANRLIFSENMPPQKIYLNEPFNVKVSAVDENFNLDSDANQLVTLAKNSGDGNLSTLFSPMSQNLTNGIVHWGDVIYDEDRYFSVKITPETLPQLTSEAILSVKDPVKGELVISEISDDNENTRNEAIGFIELYNNSDYLIDVTHFGIETNTPRKYLYTIEEGLLPAKKCMIIANGSCQEMFESLWEINIEELDALYDSGNSELGIASGIGYILKKQTCEILDQIFGGVAEFERSVHIASQYWISHLSSENGTPGKLEPFPPPNIDIIYFQENEFDFIELKWNKLYGIENYNIYFEIDPNIPKPWSEFISISDTVWTKQINPSELKKFFYITSEISE